MKDRRGFLKLLGLGASAAVGVALAAIGTKIVGDNPVIPPRVIQDIERGPKPYIGPDSVPGGDYIKERPKVVPHVEQIPILPETPSFPVQTFEIDWDTRNSVTLIPPGGYLTTTGTSS